MATSVEFRNSVEKWKKWLYWGIGILIVLAISYYLNASGRPVSSVLIFLGGLLILYYYWVKWFELMDPSSWQVPKTICPDYLTLINPGDGKTQGAQCADFIGVSANGMLTKADISSPNAIPRSAIFTIPPKAQGVDPSVICAEVQDKGLVWTGVCPEN